jgi:hypothetical protein
MPAGWGTAPPSLLSFLLKQRFIMSEQALAMPNTGVAKYATDGAFKDLAKSNDYLPRFTLYGSNSKECKKGKIPIAHYGYVEGDNVIDCGPEVRCYVLAWRPKAMRISGDKVEAYFNPEHPEFKKIKAESSIKDTGALAGPEFLLWLPEHGVFVTFFMANKTMRREASNVDPYRPQEKNNYQAKPFTLKAEFIEKNGYSWHGPVVTGCSIPLAAPEQDVLLVEMDRFNNPPEPKDEAASEADKAKTAGRAR